MLTSFLKRPLSSAVFAPLSGRRPLPDARLPVVCICVMICAGTAFCQSGKRYDVPPDGKTEILPFPSYDTDAGLGLGVKIFALNYFREEESVDLTLFWSTKGERWIRTVFSIRDFELRQGEEYPLAFDATIDYDKWVSYKFFGVGNESSYDSLETYTREPLEISILLSHGFTSSIVGTAGLRYRWVNNSSLDPAGKLAALPPEANQGSASGLGLVLSLKYDSRNSYIHPSSGLVFLAESELAPSWSFGNTAYFRGLGSVSWYSDFLPFGTILAARAYLEGAGGPDLPVQMLVGVGGTRSLRGTLQDRFLDRVAAVTNCELRFPLFWRIGGIAGIDAGKVWHSLSEMDLLRWTVSPVAGLRLYMDTFVVRADVGFGRETTGVYLNFGHLF
jgi:outer membrane protein assembly factor BamA